MVQSEQRKETWEQEFMEHLRPVHENLYRFARALARSQQETHDLVSETLLIAYERFPMLKDRKSFLSFLFTVATRIHHKQRKKLSRFLPFVRHAQEDTRPGRETPPDVSADIQALYAALALLPENQREAVVMFEISGLSLEEIRQIQGGTLSSIKSRIARGRMKLAEILKVKDSLGKSNEVHGTSHLNSMNTGSDLKQRNTTQRDGHFPASLMVISRGGQS